ncbi:hypothetical protein FDF26_13795 [Clostridium botulinum]|nr:hypothetical protein [Clostridium botulinum]
MKIGQEFKVTEPVKLQMLGGENILNVKVGDRGVVTKFGVKYLTGEARGKIVFDDTEKVIEYDVENISKRIVKSIINRYEFKEFLEDIEVSEKDLIDNALEELSEYI